MSKKPRRRTKERPLSTERKNEWHSAFRREFPTDPRLFMVGGVLLLTGGMVFLLENRFAWSGWVKAMIDPGNTILLVFGVALIFATMIGRIQGD